MAYRHVILERVDDIARITLNQPERRNTLSRAMIGELEQAFAEVATSDALGLVIAANGPVFSAGHDFGDVAGNDAAGVRALMRDSTRTITALHDLPQVVIARVHAPAIAAGCQLVASADLAIAADTAAFSLPGGKGGWFCHTPAVPVARSIGRKRLMEMALTGSAIDAATALDWGLINAVVAIDKLDEAVDDLLDRATRGAAGSKAWGKQVLYAQLDRPEVDAYRIAAEAMAASSQTADAREGMAAFLEKRLPQFE